jgi:hypothetical protein
MALQFIGLFPRPGPDVRHDAKLELLTEGVGILDWPLLIFEDDDFPALSVFALVPTDFETAGAVCRAVPCICFSPSLFLVRVACVPLEATGCRTGDVDGFPCLPLVPVVAVSFPVVVVVVATGLRVGCPPPPPPLVVVTRLDDGLLLLLKRPILDDIFRRL